MSLRFAGMVLALSLPCVAAAQPAARPPQSVGRREVAIVGSGRLADGGLFARDAAVDAPRSPIPYAGPEPAHRVLERVLSGRVPGPPSPPSPRAVGDRMVVSLDDDFDLPVDAGYEARLDVSGGPAGPTDAVAIRFRSESLVKSPPYRVSAVILGLDDLHGATTWPSVELWMEDYFSPLMPRRGVVSATTSFDAVGAGLVPAPAGSSRPTAIARLPVALALDINPGAQAWRADGSFSDRFDRADGLLDDGVSDWLECLDGICSPPLPGDPQLRIVASDQVQRTSSGFATLAVKFQASAVAAIRPWSEDDVQAQVTIRDSSATFGRAGLALRVLAADAYYRVEYIGTPPSVEVAAVTPLGPDVLGTFPVGPSLGNRVLSATITGGTPGVTIDVYLDGSPAGTVTDLVHRYIGGVFGLSASDPASSGEIWDQFSVVRRPDVFAVVAFPPGEDVGLPLDTSLDSLRSDSVLVSTDGSSFTPRPVGAGCVQPGNPFVQLEIEDSVTGDKLFQREAHVVEVVVDCATCPRAVQDCTDDTSLLEANLASPTEGEPLDVIVGWWNEHLADEDLIFRATAYEGPCDAPGAFVAVGSVLLPADAGQGAGPAQRRLAPVLTFTPASPGEYCVIVEEHHDTNGDCCPDGAETVPLPGCAGACTPIAPTDDNPSNAFVYRDVLVAPSCTPRGPDVGRDGPDDRDGDTIADEVNLDGASLRVAKGDGEEVILSWSRLDGLIFPARYNVLRMDGGRLPDGYCYRVVAPVYDQPSGTLSRTYDMPVAPGRPAYLAVYETDGCAGDASVLDSSSDDPALRCP